MLGHPTTPVYFVPGKNNNNNNNSMVGVMTGGSSAFSPLIVSQASGKDNKKANDGAPPMLKVSLYYFVRSYTSA